MSGITDRLFRHRNLPAVLAIAAALAFNNWLLGAILNPHLFFKSGSVSELSVPTQPFSLVFRLLDICSGVLFIALAVVALRIMKLIDETRTWVYILAAGMTAFGIASIIDAIFPLGCSDTLDTSCHVQVTVSLYRVILPSHAYSSITIALCYFLLPLAGYIYARRYKLRVFEQASLLTLGVALLSFAMAIHEYLRQRSLTVHTSGFPQEIQMLIVGWWIVVWFLSILRLRWTLEPVKKSLLEKVD